MLEQFKDTPQMSRRSKILQGTQYLIGSVQPQAHGHEVMCHKLLYVTWLSSGVQLAMMPEFRFVPFPHYSRKQVRLRLLGAPEFDPDAQALNPPS